MTSSANPPIRRVGVIGYGYVGRGLGSSLASVAELGWHDPSVEGSRALSDLAAWAEALFVCVPTPMSSSGSAELGIIREVIHQLSGLRYELPVVVKSTVPPGTTDELIGRWPGVPVLFCPEFLRERFYLADAASPARVVLGWTAAVPEPLRVRVRDLFRRRYTGVPIVELTSLEAELLKYASNALFGVKVSFSNEMADLAERLGASWEEVRKALVLDPRIGDGHLMVPGPDGQRGFGGKCLPKDMAALLHVAADHDVELEVVSAAVRANQRRRTPVNR